MKTATKAAPAPDWQGVKAHEAHEVAEAIDLYNDAGEELTTLIGLLQRYANHKGDDTLAAGLRTLDRTADTVLTGLAYLARYAPKVQS
jgi:hypothetical protein